MTQIPTVDDILAEIDRLSRRPDDEGKTTGEWQDTLGLSQRGVDRLLTTAHRLGRLTTGQRRAQRRDGRPTMIPVYRFVRPPKNGKGKP